MLLYVYILFRWFVGWFIISVFTLRVVQLDPLHAISMYTAISQGHYSTCDILSQPSNVLVRAKTLPSKTIFSCLLVYLVTCFQEALVKLYLCCETCWFSLIEAKNDITCVPHQQNVSTGLLLCDFSAMLLFWLTLFATKTIITKTFTMNLHTITCIVSLSV